MAKKLIRKMLTVAGGPINYKRWDDAKITSYTIPFIKEKAIKLTNAGRATGAVLSTNLLDSLADNAIRARIPIKTAIGISTKETTLGNPTDTKSAWNLSSGIRREFNGKYPGTHLHINPGRDLNERELVINYHKGHLSDTDTLGKSVILEALEFYKQHPDNYNTNQSDYLNLVNIIGEEVMKSPEVLKWYREWERSKAQIFRPEPYKINTNIQNTAQEFIPLKKQGGKMNTLEFLKKGSGIHIKKENKGKFTDYCGGKVTSECIAKGKRSPNAAIRKRATFADNARHFKHELGGPIKYKKHQAFVPGASITDSNPKAYWLLKKKKGKTEWIDKSSKGLKIKFLLGGGLLKFQEGGKNGAPVKKNSWWKRTMNNIGDFMSSDAGQFIANNLLLGGMSYLNTSNTLDASNASNQANLERTYLDIMLEAMLNRILRQLQLKNQWQLAYLNGETLDNYSDVVASHIGWKEYSQALLNAERNKKMLENLLAQLYGAAKNNAMIGLFGNLMLTGIGLLGSSTSSKYNAPSTSSSLSNVNISNLFSSPLNNSAKFWSL